MSAKRRPQGDGTIRKRVDGRWEGRIIIGHKSNGMPIYKSVFGKTQKATLAELHKLIDQYQGVDLSEECRMTLGEWLPLYVLYLYGGLNPRSYQLQGAKKTYSYRPRTSFYPLFAYDREF